MWKDGTFSDSKCYCCNKDRIAMITQRLVTEALDIAQDENGYEMSDRPVLSIAQDLCDFYPWPDSIMDHPEVSVTGLDPRDLVPFVEVWLKGKKDV